MSALLKRAVEIGEDANSAGLWHDILRMSRVSPVRLLPGGPSFQSGIRRRATALARVETIFFHGGDYGESCATIMLPEEN